MGFPSPLEALGVAVNLGDWMALGPSDNSSILRHPYTSDSRAFH